MRKWIVAVAAVLVVGAFHRRSLGGRAKDRRQGHAEGVQGHPGADQRPTRHRRVLRAQHGQARARAGRTEDEPAAAKLPVKGAKAVEVGRLGKVVVKPGGPAGWPCR